jgi:hypothetical protein
VHNAAPVNRIFIFAFILAFGILYSCSLPPIREYGIQITTRTITLEWDPPPAVFTTPQQDVFRYMVYSRFHGTNTWRFVGSIPASENPSIVINHADFGDGWFDFAVSSQNLIGGESPLNTSLDTDSKPFGGWFLKWNYAE